MMSKLNSTTLVKNVEITNQHLQQAGDAMRNTLSSTLKLGDSMLTTGKSVVEALWIECNDYKTVCSKIADNAPSVLIGVCAVSLLCPPLAYGVLTNVATCFISYPIASLTLHAAYNFFARTNGVESIKNTISSIGDVLSDSVQVVKELYNVSDSAINTVDSALKSYLLQGSNDDSKETNNEANTDKYEINTNQHAISSAGEEYDIISDTDICEVASALSGVIAVAS